MDYKKYTAEDLALDEKFQKWVLDPNSEVNGFWDQWLKENPHQKDVVDDAIELIRSAGLSTDHQLNEAYLAIWKQLHQNAQSKSTSDKSGSGSWKVSKIAAAVAFLILSSFLLWSRLSNNAHTEYRTAYGETKEFVLEDGSKVTLNSNSLLSFAPGWSEKPGRDVFLEGEAFFQVVKTSDEKSFKVNTGDQVEIQVLGTSFNVSTRREQVSVYLQSGKVRVNSNVGEAILNPGDLVIYRAGASSLNVQQAPDYAPLVMSWKEKMFIFNDTSLSEVIRQLEDNYGFTVALEDSVLSNKRITAKIPRHDVSVLLDVLSETLDIKIDRNGNHLTFKGR